MDDQGKLPLMPPFPVWLESAQIIGKNVDGESLAVGWHDGEAWLSRLSRFNNTWARVRRALQEEINKYDTDFLETMRVSLDGDNRS